MRSVAVIGGGITGLTAAYRLLGAGFEVRLFEASDRTGGVIRSDRDGEYLAECGPNTIMETTPVIGELVNSLGIRERLLYSDPAAEKKYILRDGKPVSVPSSPPAFFTSPLFSWEAKIRLIREPFVGRGNDEDESLADFVRRRLGQEFLDYAINPFVAGVYAGDPEKLSVKEAFGKVKALEDKYGSLIKGQIQGAKERKRTGAVSRQNAQKLSFDEGVQVLPDAMANALGERVSCQAPVERLEKSGKGWQINGGGDYFDAIILAMPAFRLADLAIECEGTVDLSCLSEIEYPPVASVVLGFRKDQVEHPLDGFGALIPAVENKQILGTIFSSSLFPNRAPDGHVTLTSYIGGTRAPELARQDHDQLCEMTTQNLRDIYGVSGDPTFSHSHSYERAIPQYVIGYRRFRDAMAEAEKQAPGLFIAGHSRDGIALGDSIASGDRACFRIKDYFFEAAA